MKKSVTLFVGLLLFNSCVDRVNIRIPNASNAQLVVDGLITDEPGPYTVKLSLSSKIESFLEFDTRPVSLAKVTIFDDEGNSEILEEKNAGDGIYQTKASGIRGVVGREYAIRIETHEGEVYESIPDKMNPVGEINDLHYELEAFQPLDAPTEYGFRVYVDAQGVPDSDNLFRWKFTGTYVVNTNPEFHTKPCVLDPLCCADPRPCSGFVLNGIGVLQSISNCTCCTCWVNQFEDKPYVSDNQFVSGGKFKNIAVAYVPIDYWTFLLKYRFEVKQMSLSRTAFDYWKTIQSQKEGGSSLFQPPTGKVRTNIFNKNRANEVQGIFYASAVKLKQKYLTSESVDKLFLPIRNRNLCGPDFKTVNESCLLAFKYSSNKPPADWQ
jgi:Domain of unknown function (DUF4249)